MSKKKSGTPVFTSFPPFIPSGHFCKSIATAALTVLIVVGSLAQQTQNKQFEKVASPVLASRLETISASDTLSVVVHSNHPDSLEHYIAYQFPFLNTSRNYFGQSTYFTISNLEKSELLQLIQTGLASSIELKRVPKEEINLAGMDFSLNSVHLARSKFPQFNGDGMVASIKENSFDTADIDLIDRYISSFWSSNVSSQHATTMATIINGAGNTGPSGKGVCRDALLSSADFSNLLPEPVAYFQNQNISVQNHSYGTGIENYYGIETRAFDELCQLKPELLHVFSSGNAGEQTSNTGIYANVQGFSNLTGQFKMSKNTISVGATDAFGKVAPFSSKGPAYDGRVKPELVAYGLGGSSGAAALVSGVALLMQEAFAESHQGQLPPAALLRAVLVNTSKDVGATGPDFENGYGSLQADKAIRAILDGRFTTDSVTNGQVKQLPLVVPPGTSTLKVTLAWGDPAAEIGATTALVNDLDLSMVNQSTNETWLPWTLNSHPHPDSLRMEAKRDKDSLNNLEQISLTNPPPGNYQVQVSGHSLATIAQAYSLTWQLEESGKFQWVSPTKLDFLVPEETNVIRWESSLQAASGQFSFRFIGNNWQEIHDSVSLESGNFIWNTPAQQGLAQLRCEAAGNTFLSDTFFLASQLRPKVGFDCPDSLMFFWGKIPATEAFRVFTLGNRDLEPVTDAPDSFFVEYAHDISSPFYAVAPIIDGKEGPRSATFNYTLQGTGCYFRNFLFQGKQGRTAFFTSQLGTAYGILSASLQKMKNDNFETVQNISSFTSLDLDFQDPSLQQGTNRYRLKLNLVNGGEIFSEELPVFYVEEYSYLLFPNPTPAGQSVFLLSKEQLGGNYKIYDLSGRLLLADAFDLEVTELPTGQLASGAYVLKVTDENGKRSSQLLVIN